MNTVLMAGLSAGVALGLLLIVQGVRGNRILPPVSVFFPDGTTTAIATAWSAAALVAGAITLAVTGWPGAAVGVAALVAGFPWFFGGGGVSKREIERTQAIATWSEMIRDNLAGAAGLEQALLATTDIAPAAIATEVKAFGNRLEAWSLVDALALLGRDLQHPSADLVIVTLANASRVEGRDLGSLLSRLSESIRADVRMRLRIEVGRARIRTSSRIVLGVTLLTVIMVYFLSRDLLAVYDTAQGQVWLLATFGLFLLALWLMNRFAQIRVPERFTARLSTVRTEFGSGDPALAGAGFGPDPHRGYR